MKKQIKRPVKKLGNIPQELESHQKGANEHDVQKILARSKKPLSAYDIMAHLSQLRRQKVAPVTIYRALEHLMDHGLVTRIESSNAYILCQHPHEEHDCLFFICRQCGAAFEAPDKTISHSLHKEARSLGFGINKQILEVIGLCKHCA